MAVKYCQKQWRKNKMANFIGLVYATLKNEGIDTKGMSTDEAVDKYNELKGKGEGTPAEQRKMEQLDIENVWQYMKTKPSDDDLYQELDRVGINKSGIKLYDTLAPMKSWGERANLIEKIYNDKDYRK